MKAKWIQTIIIAAVNFLLWAIPSNVPYLIAQNRDVLLGRYGVTHLTWAILVVPVSLMWLYLIWSNEKNVRQRQFQVTALALSIILPMFLVDVLMRLAQPKQYVMETNFYHRKPDSVITGINHDVPENAFSYPQMRPGYPDIEYTLTTDKIGFRNKTELEKYDIIALGDSFTEGSNITDDDVWTVKLAQKSGLSVYNLGMAGTHPAIYLETLKLFGTSLSPRMALCMLYEGNDFRDSNYEREDTISHKIGNFFKGSPLRLALQNLLIKSMSSSENKPAEKQTVSENAQAESEKEDVNPESVSAISWLPVPIPEGPDVKYYTFTVKSLLAHFEKKDSFLRTKGYRQTIASLRQIKKICDDNSIRLVIVYASDKSHVLVPLAIDKISSQTLRDFMALKAKGLPPVEELKDELLSRLDMKEKVFKDFCQKEYIDFVSLTEPLRQEVALGEQLYFTYDDHWTPLGHEVVANAVNDFLNNLRVTQKEEHAGTNNPE
jgi:hypothetical protein